MRWPWQPITRSLKEQERAEVAVSTARSHIRILATELEATLERIADKAERMAAHDR